MNRPRTSSRPPRRGRLIIVSAPSGAGKTTVVERVATRLSTIVRSCSYTSRSARPEEIDGVDYNFVEDAEFRRMIEGGAFLEWADVFGQYYGTSAADTERHRAAGRDVVLVIDVQGARQVREQVADAVSVFVLPPSFGVLETRLRDRSGSYTSEDDIRRRLGTARREIEARGDYDYIVVNDDIDACVERLYSIVVAERSTATAMRVTGDLIADTFRAPSRSA